MPTTKTEPAIVSPLTFEDSMALLVPVLTSGLPAETPRGLAQLTSKLAHVLMSVDTAAREQSWQDRGGPALVEALRWAEAALDTPRRALKDVALTQVRAALAKHDAATKGTGK